MGKVLAQHLIHKTMSSSHLLLSQLVPKQTALILCVLLQVWTVGGNWELDKTLAQHQRWVWDAAFSADSSYLVTASSDHSAKLWELR